MLWLQSETGGGGEMSYLPVGIDGGQLGIVKWPSITWSSCACRPQVYSPGASQENLCWKLVSPRKELSVSSAHCNGAKTMVHLKVCVHVLNFRLWGKLLFCGSHFRQVWYVAKEMIYHLVYLCIILSSCESSCLLTAKFNLFTNKLTFLGLHLS